ncbi:MAG: lipocalin family protein [Burkholderiales bacterium]
MARLPARARFLLFVAAFFCVSQPGAASDDLPVVASIEPARYQGRWYEIARLPNVFQRKCVSDVIADYTLRDDGRITVRNQCTSKAGTTDAVEGIARQRRQDGPNTQLEVSFLPKGLRWIPFTWGDYWILELGADYAYSVVGTPNRKYLWILSRTPSMDEERYRGILERVARLGFDVSAVARTVQR